MTKTIYPIGIQDFPKLRAMGALYVDKTPYIRRMVENGTIYFLGRPRRFGKSLLLSTLETFFEGKRELFKGLDIDAWQEWEWEKYPVIRIDLNAKNYTYPESLEERLNEHLVKYEQQYGITNPASSPDERFRQVLAQAYQKTGRKVVVLIDEYDKPVLDTMHDDTIRDMHLDSLRAFYASLKSCDGIIRFCFLTGITKFGQLNVFSGLNNIRDISLWDDYAGICGISEDELHTYFEQGVSECALKWECSVEEAFRMLKTNYDGYHFSPCLLDIYNPWSVLNAIVAKAIDTYWNQTGGGTSFLYKLLENNRIQLSNLDNARVRLENLRGTNASADDAIPILYQSGYLTIKSYDPTRMSVILKYPNKEVESGFLNGLLPAYSGMNTNESSFAIDDFVDDVRAGNVNGFLERMQAFFEDFPYENSLKTEKQFQNIMYCIMRMMGLHTQVERHSARGSADMVIQTSDYVYIMEFKIDKSPQVALEQIDSKGYALPFVNDSRQVWCIGVEFSLEARNIFDWEVKKLVKRQ